VCVSMTSLNFWTRDGVHLLCASLLWSKKKIPNIVPKTPIITRPGEPETINTWELLAVPEDIMTPLLLSHRFRSFSFDVSRDPSSIPDSPKMNLQQNGTLSHRWLQVADEDANSKCPGLDPVVEEKYWSQGPLVLLQHPSNSYVSNINF
jgi:hypothetical protein